MSFQVPTIFSLFQSKWSNEELWSSLGHLNVVLNFPSLLNRCIWAQITTQDKRGYCTPIKVFELIVSHEESDFFLQWYMQIILIDDKVLLAALFSSSSAARISIQMTRISLIAFWLLSLLRANHTFKLTELFSFSTFSHHCTWTKTIV